MSSPVRRLVVLGHGVTAERVAALCGPLYDEVQLTGDAPEIAGTDHVVIAEDEPEQGRKLLFATAGGRVMPAYLGFAAPHREGWKALVGLAAKGVAKERIDLVSSPAGVDVGAETPDEVAIAVAAELVALRHGRPRPSAGLELQPTRRRRAAEAQPRRLIGGFARPIPDDDDPAGRN